MNTKLLQVSLIYSAFVINLLVNSQAVAGREYEFLVNVHRAKTAVKKLDAVSKWPGWESKTHDEIIAEFNSQPRYFSSSPEGKQQAAAIENYFKYKAQYRDTGLIPDPSECRRIRSGVAEAEKTLKDYRELKKKHPRAESPDLTAAEIARAEFDGSH